MTFIFLSLMKPRNVVTCLDLIGPCFYIQFRNPLKCSHWITTACTIFILEYSTALSIFLHSTCHTGLIGSRPFQNYAFKGWLSLETMKLRLLGLTKTLFLMSLNIKLTLGNISIKVKNPPGGATITK